MTSKEKKEGKEKKGPYLFLAWLHASLAWGLSCENMEAVLLLAPLSVVLKHKQALISVIWKASQTGSAFHTWGGTWGRSLHL